MPKLKLATTWLDGCSGCHMSFLDIDERLLAVAEKVDLVYSPLVDRKDFPDHVDITIVEGAVSSDGDYDKIKKIRDHSDLLVALGDCAVNANVPSMRNPFKVQDVLARGYLEHADTNRQIPLEVVPALRPHVVPIHEVVHVDVFIPGCPPAADTIFYALTELLEGRVPELAAVTRFGK
jgi:NAD-reducing hydrogenase small subunit